MKAFISTILLVCVFATGSYAQKNFAKTLSSLHTSEYVTITYDINHKTGIETEYQVELRIMGIPSDKFVGELVATGTGAVSVSSTNSEGRTIEWFYKENGFAERDIAELSFEVLASLGSSGSMGAPVPWTLIGGIAAPGLTLLVSGLTKESTAQDDYKVYEEIRDPGNAVYQDFEASGGLSQRGAYYEDVNKRHKSAQLMMAGGGVIVAVAGAILVSHLTKKNKFAANRKVELFNASALNTGEGLKSGAIFSQVGVGLRIKL